MTVRKAVESETSVTVEVTEKLVASSELISLKRNQVNHGLTCGAINGLDSGEPRTGHLNSRQPPMLPHLASEAGGMMLSCPTTVLRCRELPIIFVVRHSPIDVATCFHPDPLAMCDHGKECGPHDEPLRVRLTRLTRSNC